MNLEHVKIERMDSYPTSKDFVENFADMHTIDIIRYANSRNLQYLEWQDMVSLVHELADRLETAYEWAARPMSKEDMEETLNAIGKVFAKEGRSP